MAFGLITHPHDLFQMCRIFCFANHEVGDILSGNKESAFRQVPIDNAVGVFCPTIGEARSAHNRPVELGGRFMILNGQSLTCYGRPEW